MKYILLIFLSLIFFYSSAQKKQNVYYFKNNGFEVQSKDSSDFFRVIEEPDSTSTYFNIKEYYKSGNRKMIGKLSSFFPSLIFEDRAITFYENGKRASIENYKDNVLIGSAYYYYFNGVVREERNYLEKDKNQLTPSIKYSVIQVVDSSGNKFLDTLSNGVVDITDHYGNKESGAYVKGLKNGIWKSYNAKLKENYEDNYEDGKLIFGKTIESNGNVINYDESEKLPQFVGGTNAFAKLLLENLKYPDGARKNKIQGNVYLSFAVEINGNLSDFKIVKSVDEELDAEALRVIKLSPKWTPAMKKGKPVRSFYSIPISFQLR